VSAPVQTTATDSALVEVLENPVRGYAWGSRTAIPDLLGVPPTGEPQAELWMGAHPGAPSRLHRGGRVVSLLEAIRADPARALGPAVTAEFGPRLPFLLKVIAAEAPLSLQVHPNAEQAREGYAEEDARGVPVDSPQRNYRDPNPKPELVCALSPFEVLCGFRELGATTALLDLLTDRCRLAAKGTPARRAADALAPFLAALHARPDQDGLREVVTGLLTLPRERRDRFVDAVAAGCRAVVEDGSADASGFGADLRTAVDLAEAYPGDTGVVISLLLNRITLQPGQAIFLPAGKLHAYLRGVAVEVMANSDNVLRGGLTPKHVDVAELLRILDVADGPVQMPAARVVGSAEVVYDSPTRWFRLSRLALGDEPTALSAAGPQVMVTVAGSATVTGQDGRAVTLPRGTAAWVPAAAGPTSLRGPATLFRATTNLDPAEKPARRAAAASGGRPR
jgi:mannose-6-phosphate isomerase